MDTQNPQEAFFTCLGQTLARAMAAVRGPDGGVEYLSRSVDHADLERRLRVLQHRAGNPMSQLMY